MAQTNKQSRGGVSVRTQIILAFATLAGILIVYAAAVLFSFDTIKRSIHIVAFNTVPILDRVGEVQENTSLIQIALLLHMVATDAEKKAAAEREIARAYGANTVLLQKKKGLVLTPGEEAMYENVLASRATYTRYWQQMLALSRTGRQGELAAFNEQTLLPAYAAYQKVLNRISAYLKAETKKRASRVDDFMEAVRSICNVLSVAGLCIAAGMGLVIVQVTKRLREDNRILAKEIGQRKNAEHHQDMLILELKDALDNIKQLSGLLPICASCKKIRDDRGYWQRIETYISEHSKAQFTHGVCPECSEKMYPPAKTKSRS